MHFVTCPKQGREMEAVVPRRVGFLAYSCPKQGQDFQPSAAPLYPNMSQVPPLRGCPSLAIWRLGAQDKERLQTLQWNTVLSELT